MNPLTSPPYPWAEAAAIGIDEPGHANADHDFDITISEETAIQTLFDCWDRSYPNRSGKN